MEQERHVRGVWRDLLQQLDPFAPQGGIVDGETGHVAAGSREARGEAAADWVGYCHEHNARAASGHAAALPSTVMNSRRLIWLPCRWAVQSASQNGIGAPVTRITGAACIISNSRRSVSRHASHLPTLARPERATTPVAAPRRGSRDERVTAIELRLLPAMAAPRPARAAAQRSPSRAASTARPSSVST
jgi:hypothetical protein